MICRSLILLLIPLCFLAPAHAQRALVWQPDTTLRLGGPVPFSSVTIEDARPDKSTIGWLKTGALNRYADLVMADSVSKSLAAYSRHLLRGGEAAPGELFVVLRDFRVEDRKGGEEIGTVHLHADLFWSGTGEGAFSHLRSYDTLYETKSGWDVTKGVQVLASQSILDMVTAANIAFAARRPDTVIRNREDAIRREDEIKATWPLYTEAVPTRGIYHSFDEFLHLRTSDTAFIDIKVASPDAPAMWYFYRKNSRGKKGDRIEPNEAFAIYDGTRWHIAHRRGFSLMKKDGNDYYTTQYLLGLTDNSATMGLMFGAVGAAIAAGDQSQHYTPYRTRLSPEAGRFVPIKRAR